MKKQPEIKDVKSIADLVKNYSKFIDTEQRFRIPGVSITPYIEEMWWIRDDTSVLPCRGEGIELQEYIDVTAIVTYHGTLLKIYNIEPQITEQQSG